jgi:hypothetical protein
MKNKVNMRKTLTTNINHLLKKSANISLLGTDLAFFYTSTCKKNFFGHSLTLVLLELS